MSQSPSKHLNILIRGAYAGKPMSLSDMDQDDHTAVTMHTVWHEYAPTAIALSAYSCHKVKSTHGQRRLLIWPWESIIQSAQSPTHAHAYIYIYIYTNIMHNAITQSRKVNQTLPTFQGHDPTRYRKCKTNITIVRICALKSYCMMLCMLLCMTLCMT